MSIMKIYTHLKMVKLLSYYLLLGFSFVSFALLVAFNSHRFTINNTSTLTNSPQVIKASIPGKTLSGSENSSAWNRDDEELMYRARMVQEIDGIASKKVPKIAFMFLIKGSLPLAPLWEELFKGHEGYYSIYVHSQASSYKNYSSQVETGVFRGRVIPSKEVTWAMFSMVEAELRLLANALLDPSNQRFVLLSESCIPLFNFTTIYSHLMNSNQTHVETYDLPGQMGRGRYKKGIWPGVTLQQWRKGSQWFEIDRDLATKVISDKGYFVSFQRACEKSFYPCCADEHYLPTWVNIYQGPKNSDRSLTWVDWTRGGAHPATFRRMHISAGFLNWLRTGQTCEYNGTSSNTCYLFARKFSPDTLGRLLRLAPRVMHF